MRTANGVSAAETPRKTDKCIGVIMNDNQWHDLKSRTLSGVVLLAFALFAIFYHADSFAMFVLIGGLFAVHELRKLSASLTNEALYKVGGFCLLGVCCYSLIYIRLYLEKIDVSSIAPYWPVLTLLIIVISVDIGGFFFGKIIGGKKCWPSISPGKTWSGTIASIIIGLIAALLLWHFAMNHDFHIGQPLIALLLISGAIAGDALESWLKRKAGVKDSGKLIPGHGGVLDRIDGLLFSAPIFALTLHFNLL